MHLETCVTWEGTDTLQRVLAPRKHRGMSDHGLDGCQSTYIPNLIKHGDSFSSLAAALLWARVRQTPSSRSTRAPKYIYVLVNIVTETVRKKNDIAQAFKGPVCANDHLIQLQVTVRHVHYRGTVQ